MTCYTQCFLDGNILKQQLPNFSHGLTHCCVAGDPRDGRSTGGSETGEAALFSPDARSVAAMSPKYVSIAPAAGSAAVLSPAYDVCSPVA